MLEIDTRYNNWWPDVYSDMKEYMDVYEKQHIKMEVIKMCHNLDRNRGGVYWTFLSDYKKVLWTKDSYKQGICTFPNGCLINFRLRKDFKLLIDLMEGAGYDLEIKEAFLLKQHCHRRVEKPINKDKYVYGDLLSLDELKILSIIALYGTVHSTYSQ